MAFRVRLLLIVFFVLGARAWGQAERRDPHVGYLYPAGGRRGTVVQVTVGGQFLRGVTDAIVTGEGVHVTGIEYIPPLRGLTPEQRVEIRRRLQAARQKILAKMGRPAMANGAFGGDLPGGRLPAAKAATSAKIPAQPVELPDHPLLRNLDKLNLRQLMNVANELFLDRKKQQQNAQLAEMVVMQVAIDPNATPTEREIRLRSPAGLTNPLRFEVGTLPEALEEEVNDPDSNPLLGPTPIYDLPIVLNGQIKPGDVDRFRFRARRGQKLVMDAQARRLMPYLADAVPGWFQATLALYGPNGKQVAFADNGRFQPDPVICYEVPANGIYELEIRDALYRGREDFVYRLAAGELPLVTRMFPLGARIGSSAIASIAGWNLPVSQLELDARPSADGVRRTILVSGEYLSDPVSYAVDDLPECNETEPNDDRDNAQSVTLPIIVNGRVNRPGDVDVYSFKGYVGEEVVAEVIARRLGSPLDSFLQLTDASGNVLAWNDDHEDPEAGLVTHHADSYLRARLPKDGTYYARLSDVQHHGGDDYAYRLRLGPPRPDFALRMTPSSVSAPVGRGAPIDVHVVRKDGFDGPIELGLRNAPAGFRLDGARVPAGRDHVRMTLAWPQQPFDQPVELQLEGRARIGGEIVSRPVVPAEDMMQAFIYRHLVPSQKLLVSGPAMGRRGWQIWLTGDNPVRIPAGGTAVAQYKSPNFRILQNLKLELNDPPKGVTLQRVAVTLDGLALVLKADGKTTKPGYADNLIVDAFIETTAPRPGGRPGAPPVAAAGRGIAAPVTAGARRPAISATPTPGAATQPRRVYVGVLPAIPFEIVQR
jgi:hypothetical protein